MEHPVILIHGAFAGPWCMENFAGYFRDRGWTCHVPALRHHGGDPKAAPDPALATTSIDDYTADLADFIETLETPPVILGHAVGGVIAQKLAAMSLAQAIVLLNPHAPWGVLPSTDDEHHPYSLVRTVDGETAWCSGVLPYNVEGELEAEPDRAIDAALRVLEERLSKAGATLDDVVKVTVFLADIEWRPRLDEAWRRTWDDPRPARTALQVARLPKDAMIELDAIVHRPAGV